MLLAMPRASSLLAPSHLRRGLHHRIRLFSTEELPASEATPDSPLLTEISRLEIRVGNIVSVSRHPTLEKIFVEQIDIGETEPRTICSGLVGYLEEVDLLGKPCVVLANLKPRDLEGVPSDGMVLCASSNNGVQLVTPPMGSSPGELLTVAGHKSAPEPAGNRAVKAWKKVGGNFAMVNGVATFNGKPSGVLQASLGTCTSAISNGPIS